MIVGVLKETTQNRVAIVPKTVKKLKGLNCEVYIESGAGDKAYFSNDDYTAEGASIQSRGEILANADIVIAVEPPADDDLSKMKSKAAIVSMFQPYFDESIKERLAKFDIIPFSMDMIPRTTIAQSMDILSSMASVAGYKAVLAAAHHLPNYYPMLITAAGSIKPSTVVVLGAGVAGLQAIATAKRLGAVVEAFDVRAAAKEEVQSLGAKFIEVEGAADSKDAGGYAVQQSEDFIKRQRALVQERAIKANVIITTAQVRGRKAPILVPASTVEKMKPGSIIVDLAASTGGNCELTEDGKISVHHGVSIIGDSNLADKMPNDSSTLFSNNVFNFLKLVITKEGDFNLDMDNEIVRSTYFTHEEKA